MQTVGWVYGLACECDSAIRYVGMTNKTVDHRLDQHLDEARRRPTASHKCKWLNRHLLLGHTITATTLCEVPVASLVESERTWIARGVELGWPLTNGRAYDWTPASVETRAKISAARKGQPSKMKGKKMSAKGRANVSRARKRWLELNGPPAPTTKGRALTDEHKAKISAGVRRTGYRHNAEMRAQISASHQQRVRTQEEREAHAAAGRMNKGKKRTEAQKAAMAASPQRGIGNHVRWHVTRGTVSADCRHCAG